MQQGLFHFCLTLISTRYQTSIHNCCKRASIREGFAHVLFCSCRGMHGGDIWHASVRCVPITLNCVAEGTLVDLAFSFRLGNSHTIHYFPQAARDKTEMRFESIRSETLCVRFTLRSTRLRSTRFTLRSASHLIM